MTPCSGHCTSMTGGEDYVSFFGSRVTLLTHVELKVSSSSRFFFTWIVLKSGLSYSILVGLFFFFPLYCQGLHLYLRNIRGKPTESVVPHRESDVFKLNASSLFCAYSSNLQE